MSSSDTQSAESKRKPLRNQNTIKRLNKNRGPDGYNKTPNFINPNESMKTVKKSKPRPKVKQRPITNSTLIDYNDSSILEKHTINLESDTEFIDNNSQAPTESQHVQNQQTVNYEDSSLVEGGNLASEEEQKSSQKVDSDKPPHFNEEDNEKNLATFREKQKSQSDIHYGDVDLEEMEGYRESKTALEKSRKFNTINPNKGNSYRNDKTLQLQLKQLNISASERDRLNDEIYLNTNSAEENPDGVHFPPDDSRSITKRTLELRSHTTESAVEGESGLSVKEEIVCSDKNLQISSEHSPTRNKNLQISQKGSPFHDQNIQTTAKSALMESKSPHTNQKMRKFTSQNEYINNEKSKLQLSNGRREKAQSSKDKNESLKSSMKTPQKPAERYGKNKPFEYNQSNSHQRNIGIPAQNSQEKKMPDRITHTRADVRPKDDNYSIPEFGGFDNKSVEYYPHAVPQIQDKGVQPSTIGKSEGVQFDLSEKPSGTQIVAPQLVSEGVQFDPDDKSQGIQMTPHNAVSEGMQFDMDNKSQGVQMTSNHGISEANQYNFEDKKSQGIQMEPNLTQTQGIQHSPERKKSQGLQINPERKKSQGLQVYPDQTKSEGIQMTNIGAISEGNQVGSSINTPVSYISVGNKGYQFDVDNYNRSIQADTQPLKDMDVQ